MYRIIASSDYEYSAENLSRKLKAIRNDIRLISRCDTIEDIEANVDKFQAYNGKFILRNLTKKPDFEEAADNVLDSLYEFLRSTKEDIEKARENESNMQDLADILSAKLSQIYDVQTVSEFEMYVIPPEGATHKDCIAFVDEVCKIINGKFYGTGRGGSWSKWNLRSDKNVAVNAGWATHFEKWAPEDSWIVEIVHNN